MRSGATDLQRNKTQRSYVQKEPSPALPPPIHLQSRSAWVVKNFFSSPVQSLMTVLMCLLVGYVTWNILQWAVIDAVWTGDTGEACRGPGRQEGACWAMVRAKWSLWVYGFYPVEERWRVDAVFLFGALFTIPLMMPSIPFKRLNGVFLLIVFPALALLLFTGGNFSVASATWMIVAGVTTLAAVIIFLAGIFRGFRNVKTPALLAAGIVGAIALLLTVFSYDFGLAYVETSSWGGLQLTLVVAVTGIVGSLTLGVVLALGRQSSMFLVRLFCTAFIELWRGVPLITVLFMASVMLPLFMPDGVTVDKLIRALIGVSLFNAAYMAEVVRGGLQAIPKGQTEAAKALGLSYGQYTGLIILPQALKLVIPGIVNTFIGLFKDTTLVGIVGLFDLLLIINTASTDKEWIAPQTHATGLFVAAMVFWFFCFGMSRYSMFLERHLDTGHRT